MRTKKSQIPNTDLVVVKSNRLVEACYRLDLTELRVVMLAVVIARELDVLTEGPDRNDCKPFKVDVKRFAEFFPSMEEKSIYGQVKKAVQSLHRKIISYLEVIEGNEVLREIHWFEMAGYNKQKGYVDLQFSRPVVPFISRLTKEFTEYRLEKIGMLTSAHAVRLYEILFQYLKAGKREIEIAWLKKTLVLEDDEYPSVYELKRRVIDSSVAQINQLTDLEVSYINVKHGRNVIALDFTIRMKPEHRPKPKTVPVNNALLSSQARPGEARDTAYNRLVAERKTGKIASKAIERNPVALTQTAVCPVQFSLPGTIEDAEKIKPDRSNPVVIAARAEVRAALKTRLAEKV